MTAAPPSWPPVPVLYEYRTEAISLQPGRDKETRDMLATDTLLNQYAAEGWRVVGTHVVPIATGSKLDVNTKAGLGLLVVLERRRGV